MNKGSLVIDDNLQTKV